MKRAGGMPMSTLYNDFGLLIGKLLPDRYRCSAALVTSDKHTDGVAYLQTCTPIWPVMAGGK
jgi:hypothetical protein